MKNENNNTAPQTIDNDVNEVETASLKQSIQQLKQLLNSLRTHDFKAISDMKRITMQGQSYSPKSAYCQNEVASIRLMGRWLNKLGFLPGERLCLIPSNGLLIICPENFKEEEAQTCNNPSIIG